jgi:hypothetical protein
MNENLNTMIQSLLWQLQYINGKHTTRAQKPEIMSWPPQHMRSNSPSATTSPSRSLQPKTKNKPKMKLQ